MKRNNISLSSRIFFYMMVFIVIESILILKKDLPVKLDIYGPYWGEEDYSKNLINKISILHSHALIIGVLTAFTRLFFNAKFICSFF